MKRKTYVWVLAAVLCRTVTCSPIVDAPGVQAALGPSARTIVIMPDPLPVGGFRTPPRPPVKVNPWSLQRRNP